MTMVSDKYEHAFGNAKAWFEGLLELYHEINPGTDCSPQRQEAIDQEIDEMPLSIDVRSAWYTPGATAAARYPIEFAILLTTGGPALRVWGGLSEHGEPESAQLQMQDWGVPWREVWPCEVAEMDEAREALLWFAQRFYFGD